MSLFGFFKAHWVQLMLHLPREHGKPTRITPLKKINSPSPSSHQLPIASLLRWGLMSPSPIAIWILIGLIFSRSWAGHEQFVPRSGLYNLSTPTPERFPEPSERLYNVDVLFRDEHSIAPYSLYSWTFYLHLRQGLLFLPFCILKDGWPESFREISTFSSNLTIRVQGSQIHTYHVQRELLHESKIKLRVSILHRVTFLLPSTHFIVDSVYDL